VIDINLHFIRSSRKTDAEGRIVSPLHCDVCSNGNEGGPAENHLPRKVWTGIGDAYHSGHISTEGRERGMATVGKRETERSRCIDRRHKIHFMTWTLSSDWCISRRIASQIKRSSTPELPLTISPGPRRRRTVLSAFVCISYLSPPPLSFSLSLSLLSSL